MTEEKFDRDLLNAIGEILPFDIEDVINIEESLGTIYIDVENGDTYYLTIEKSEE